MFSHTKRNIESVTSIAKNNVQFKKYRALVFFICSTQWIYFQTFYVWIYNSADILHQTVLLSFLLKCFRSIIVSVHNNICTLAFHNCCVTLKIRHAVFIHCIQVKLVFLWDGHVGSSCYQQESTKYVSIIRHVKDFVCSLWWVCIINLVLTDQV